MKRFLREIAQRATHNIIRNTTNIRTRKRVISRFAEKVGLLYFGTVNQHSDDHRVVRGFTVSSSHQDNHYSIGSVGGYDITIVDRSDVVRQHDGSIFTYNWLIMSFDLHTKQDTPHFFLGARNRNPKPYATFFATFPVLKEVNLGTFEEYGSEFTSRFSLYAQPSMSIEVERLIPANAARVLGVHFWPFSAELHEGVLYIYSDDERVTPNLLETMFENGLWLANHLDLQIELV